MRTRPASAQPSTRATTTPPTMTAPYRRQEYRPRRLPLSYWDDRGSAAGDDSNSGITGDPRRNSERKTVTTAGAAGNGARASSALLTKDRAEDCGVSVRRKLWDDCCVLRAGQTAERVAAERAAIEVDVAEIDAAGGTPSQLSPKRKRGTGGAGAVVVGRPYMSRADLAAEGSKEAEQLR